MICASVYLLVFIQNHLKHRAEKILLMPPLLWGGITRLADQFVAGKEVVGVALTYRLHRSDSG